MVSVLFTLLTTEAKVLLLIEVLIPLALDGYPAAIIKSIPVNDISATSATLVKTEVSAGLPSFVIPVIMRFIFRNLSASIVYLWFFTLWIYLNPIEFIRNIISLTLIEDYHKRVFVDFTHVLG